MKTIISYLGIAVVVLLVYGCREIETENISRLTYFPDFTVSGEQTMFLETGETYTEPGVSAEESGSEIEVSTAISGTYFVGSIASLNTDVADKYTINYSAINSDGFPGSVSRTVYVAGKGDLVNDISGLYTSTVVRNGSSAPEYTDMGYVFISKTGANTYKLSDGIGGYYDLGRAYGAGYAASGVTITANDIPTNDFTLPSGFGVGAFGGSADMSDMVVDAGSKTISFSTDWDAGYVFVVTLTQVDF